MHIPSHTLGLILEILGFKGDSRLVGIWNDEEIEAKGECGNEGGGHHVRQHHPMEADSTGQYGDDLRIRSHLGCKEYYRNEHEQRAEHIHEVRNKVYIIVKDDGFERRFLGHKVINSLTDIEDDHNTDDEEQRHKEGADELPHYVQIYLSWSEVKLHFP